MSQTVDKCREAESQGIGMMLQRMAVFDTLESKEEALVGYTKSAGGRLGRWGNLRAWVKRKTIDTCVFNLGGCRIAHSQQFTH